MSGAHIAIHAAQEAEKQLEIEEMEMTKYTDQELTEEWEFKIVRSVTGKFKNPNALAQVVEEENMAGWVLLEKFDDKRLRFKRPVANRRKDHMLPAGVDPYRTTYGMSEASQGMLIFFFVIGALSLMILGMYFAGVLN